MKTRPAGMLSNEEAAEFLGVHRATLNRWRYDDRKQPGKDKPVHFKMGGAVMYRKKDLEKFLEACAIRSVADEYS